MLNAHEFSYPAAPGHVIYPNQRHGHNLLMVSVYYLHTI